MFLQCVTVLLSARPALDCVSIASSSFVAEKLPLSYCQTWPLWCASPGESGGQVLRHVNPYAGASEPSDMWVDPVTFESLWMPADLAIPSFHLALTLVLKDGTPRYLGPTLDATVRAAGREWRNRGMCSVPMPRTWLPWREIPVDELRISAYVQPPPPASVEGEEAAAVELPYEPLVVLQPVHSGLAAAAEVLAEAPSALASGFTYLNVRLPAQEQLSSSLLQPGARLRVFLSDADAFPSSIRIDEDDSGWAWVRGECDMRLMAVAPGGSSEYLPEVYRPLYHEQGEER
jgi:hypothetical protein